MYKPVERNNALRAIFLVALLCQASVVAYGYTSSDVVWNEEYATTGEEVDAGVNWSAVTVVTTQRVDSTGVGGELVAVDADGDSVYYNGSLASYWDVDPVPGTRATVVYVATERLPASVCGGSECSRNVIERLNMSTDEATRLYSHRVEGGRWHDVDAKSPTEFVVADFGADSVFVVNTSTEIRTWTWTAESAVPISSGGPYTRDFTHVNDVELLPDGRIMVSLRNQDRVVFLNESGLVPSWTLGSEDDYSTLFEQHNPDYLSERHGGPAVLVADSENDRIVEYHREDGEWNREWTYGGSRVAWPRDADRLPNGNTLITSSNGDLVFEVDSSGSVVWSVSVNLPYEAERLGTPPESAGPTLSDQRDGAEADGDVRQDEGNKRSLPKRIVTAVIPQGVENAILFVRPVWMGFWATGATVGIVGTAVLWAGFEWWARDLSITVRLPIELR